MTEFLELYLVQTYFRNFFMTKNEQIFFLRWMWPSNYSRVLHSLMQVSIWNLKLLPYRHGIFSRMVFTKLEWQFTMIWMTTLLTSLFIMNCFTWDVEDSMKIFQFRKFDFTGIFKNFQLYYVFLNKKSIKTFKKKIVLCTECLINEPQIVIGLLS